jgi:hypothetical protein
MNMKVIWPLSLHMWPMHNCHFQWFIMIFSSFREEIEKQRSILHYKRLQEEGKTDQARKDLGEGLHLVYFVWFCACTLYIVDNDDIFHYIHVNTPHQRMLQFWLEEMAYHAAILRLVQVHMYGISTLRMLLHLMSCYTICATLIQI